MHALTSDARVIYNTTASLEHNMPTWIGVMQDVYNDDAMLSALK